MLALLLVLVAGAPGCGFSQRQVGDLADELAYTGPDEALRQLDKLSPPDRDRSHYQLTSGMLKLLSGDFRGSIRDLEAAKQRMASLQAISVSESLGAGTINETLRAYAGSPGERVMLQQVLALAYLLLGELDSARVEVLQADVLMRTVPQGDDTLGQLASARYLGGLIFELQREWSDAMISYRKAGEILSLRGQPLPRALKDSLLELSQRLGLDDEHRRYRETFGYAVSAAPPGGGELIVFYWDGLVSRLRQHFLTVYVPDLQQNVSLALPYYPPVTHTTYNLAVRTGAEQASTQVLEDLDALVRQDLRSREAGIYAMTLARMVSKYQVVRAAREENPYAGMVVNLAALFTEIADTRSWNVLPATIQVTRIPLSPGEHSAGLSGDFLAPPQTQPGPSLSVVPGRKNVVLASSVTRRIFSQAY